MSTARNQSTECHLTCVAVLTEFAAGLRSYATPQKAKLCLLATCWSGVQGFEEQAARKLEGWLVSSGRCQEPSWIKQLLPISQAKCCHAQDLAIRMLGIGSDMQSQAMPTLMPKANLRHLPRCEILSAWLMQLGGAMLDRACSAGAHHQTGNWSWSLARVEDISKASILTSSLPRDALC